MSAKVCAKHVNTGALNASCKHEKRKSINSKNQTKPRSVNSLEQRRALRHVQELHKSLKMPVPQLPAVLAYLRWLDKMESWSGRRHPSSINQSEYRGENQMFSWSGNFGNPIALPNIKKYPDSEKYSSRQFKELVMSDKEPVKKIRSYSATKQNKSEMIASYKDPQKKSKSALYHYYRPEEWSSKLETQKSKSVYSSPRGVRYNGKPTPFYIHAKEGFQYWPKEIYNPPIHHTKYSFGDRFNPGRAGVITDRIYAQPRINKHYWTDFQLRQNPIGSGNTVIGNVLTN